MRAPALLQRTSIATAVLCGITAIALTGCRPYEYHGVPVDPPEPAAPVEGLNWNGEPFSLAQLHGRVVVVFFGYASCPDICPVTLAKLKRVKSKLAREGLGDDLAVVLVSVDPERDTLEVLAQYVPSFDPSFFGVRLELSALEAVTSGYYVAALRRDPDESGFYTVDHTGSLFVLDRAGRLALRFPNGTGAEEMGEDLAHLARRGSR